MTEQKYIGTVVSVTSGIVTVLLDESITTLKREVSGKSYFIGQLGTYILIPMGAVVIVGMTNKLEKREIVLNGKSHLRYVLEASLVGTVKGGRYDRGVSFFPSVDAPVFLAEDSDLTVAFSVYQRYGFSVGTISLFETQRAFLDPNRFFAKHIAVLGSSGSGKSCTVASILQKVASFPDTNIIILDLHNEYRAAFKDANYIRVADFELPFWLMNFDEICEMFIDNRDENASTQITVLKDLIINSKKGKNPNVSLYVTIDTPVVFDISEIRARIQYMDTEKISMGGGVTREGPFYGKFTRFLVRLDGKLNDPRYEFMFRPKKYTTSESLNNFLTSIFGAEGKARITILDLSGVPFDVVNTIVSVLARTIFDFNFWNPHRREFPILLVFEEAHNYLPSSVESTARRTVERIAKEGRKYGVSIMVVSQRPAEVSETILSQCSNYVVLRLTNPNDQNYIRRLVPDTFTSLIEVLPSLRQGEALVVGEATPMPLRVQIDTPNPEPDSGDIKFYEKWKKSESSTKIETVVSRWWKQEKD